MVAAAGLASAERIGLTFGAAFVLHALIIFGITFVEQKAPPPLPTMEITLAQYKSEKAPDKADFLAQMNQQGSGTEDAAKKLASTRLAEMRAQTVAATALPKPPEPPPGEKLPSRARPAVATNTKQTRKVELRNESPAAQQKDPSPKPSLLERSIKIASLQTVLSEQMQAYAKRPRVTRLTSASTMGVVDAFYMQNWLRKVEEVGNLNYPEEAKKKKIYGRLRLLVALLPDGTVKEIRVMKSSGYKVLDDAAIRIVRLAAPFAPFPESVRDERDVLEIIRTWSFQKKGLSSY